MKETEGEPSSRKSAILQPPKHGSRVNRCNVVHLRHWLPFRDPTQHHCGERAEFLRKSAITCYSVH